MASNLKPYADLKVALRKYTDNEGNEKTAWLKVGTLFSSPHQSHMFISMEALPVKDWDGAVSVFKRDDWVDVDQVHEVTDDPITLDDIQI